MAASGESAGGNGGEGGDGQGGGIFVGFELAPGLTVKTTPAQASPTPSASRTARRSIKTPRAAATVATAASAAQRN